MKKVNILKLIIALLIIFLIVITFLVFKGKEVLDSTGFINTLTDNANIDSNINYLELYKDNIIYEKYTNYDYEILKNDSTLYGKIYIDLDGYLNITNDFTKTEKRVNNEKFISIYRNVNYNDKLIVYALSETNKVYKIVLETTNLKEIKYYDLQLKSKLTNFTNLNVNYVSSSEIVPVVLCDDNKMYALDYGLLYSKDYYELYDKYIIFNDNTAALTSGKIIKDVLDNKVKIQGYIKFDEDIFNEKPIIALITEDGQLIYKYSDSKVYIYNKLIKNIEGYGTLKVIFYDDTYFEFAGNYVSILDNQES